MSERGREVAKRTLRRALTSAGLEVRRVDRGVRRSLPAVLQHYASHGYHPSTVVDVGVAAGTPELYGAFPDARLVLVEPVQEWRAHLEQLTAGRRAEVVIAAAGSAPGEVEIMVHRVPELTTMVGARPNDASESERRTVPMARLDDIARDLQLVGPALLKIDVEGGELEVLRGASELLADCEIVLLEVAFVELIEGAPLFHDVVAEMHRLGFVVGELYNGHTRPLDGALAQMDVAFLREDSRFRRASGYGSREQNDTLYRSWGR